MILLVKILLATCLYGSWGDMKNVIQLRPAFEVAGSISRYLEESGNSKKTLAAKEQDLEYFQNFVGVLPLAAITARTCKEFAVRDLAAKEDMQ
jgi:hypothetical protein